MSDAVGILSSYKPVSAFTPISLGWTSAWWAGGPRFAALGLADGATVSSWPDEKGSQDFGQATAGLRPVYRVSVAALNNRPAIDPDGVDDYLVATITAIAPPVSLVVVSIPEDIFANKTVIDQDSPGPGLNFPHSNRQINAMLNASNLTSTAGTYTGTDGHLVSVYYNAASSVIEMDGTVKQSGTLGAATGFVAGPLRVFSSTIPNQWTQREVAFVGISAGDIRTDPGWINFKTWAATHYAITIA